MSKDILGLSGLDLIRVLKHRLKGPIMVEALGGFVEVSKTKLIERLRRDASDEEPNSVKYRVCYSPYGKINFVYLEGDFPEPKEWEGEGNE